MNLLREKNNIKNQGRSSSGGGRTTKKRVRFAIENSEQAAQDQVSSPVIHLQPIVMENSAEEINSPKTQLEASPGKKKEKLEKDQANITIDR